MHIYWGYIYPSKLTIYLCNIITPKNYHIWHNAYILKIHIGPFQLTINLWNTVTQNKCQYSTMHIYWGYIYIPNWHYNYGILLHQITITYSRKHIYWGYIYSPQTPIDNISMKYQNAHILRIHLPSQIDNRSLQYHYTK